MKTTDNQCRKMMLVMASLLMISPLLFADGTIREIYLTGSTDSPAGEYVVLNTDNIYYFNGIEYDVYRVEYEDHAKDMFLAVHTGKDCNSFIAYNGKFTFFYACDEDGFGIRKVMFNHPDIQKGFSCEKFRCQSVLCKKHRAERRVAIKTVAEFVPDLYENAGG